MTPYILFLMITAVGGSPVTMTTARFDSYEACEKAGNDLLSFVVPDSEIHAATMEKRLPKSWPQYKCEPVR
jgi:hypothetical protein